MHDVYYIDIVFYLLLCCLIIHKRVGLIPLVQYNFEMCWLQAVTQSINQSMSVITNVNCQFIYLLINLELIFYLAVILHSLLLHLVEAASRHFDAPSHLLLCEQHQYCLVRCECRLTASTQATFNHFDFRPLWKMR